MRRSLPLLLTILILGLTFAEVSNVRADTSKLAQGAQLDLTPESDGTTDIQGKQCNCPAATSLGVVNGAQWASAPTSYASATLSQAQSASYGSGDFVPGEFEAYFIKTGNNKFYKLQFPPGGTNDGSGIDLEYDYLGTGLPPAPNANFSYTAYDLIVRFTDTSTGGPASWSWTFGDGETGNGSFQQHVYYNPGTYNVCLTASNTGGDDTYCENVTVSQVPSTLVAPGGSIDFNSDGINDLQVLSAPECSSTNKMRTLNSATYSFLGEDYRTATEADVLSKPFTSSGDFCTQPSDISDGVALKTGNDGILKYWTVANDDRGIRFEFEVYDSGLPPAPTASFTHETLDLIAKFTDTSTGSPSSWSWDFGDSSTSTNQNPQHVYADAGTYNVCLTATNAGGSSTPSCQNVTVTRLPSSVTLADGQSIDLNSDGVDDLFADVCNCGGNGEVMNLNVMNTAQWGTVNVINTDYYGVTLTDLQNSTITGTSPFIPSAADVYDTYGIRTGTNALVKLWSPENTNAGIRIEFEVLTAGETPPSTPVASFTADTPDANGLGLSVNFTDTSPNTPTAWAWDFGDGGTSSVRNPSHTFSSGGQYNVCLTATNSGGSDTNCQNLIVTESPNANFAFSINGLVVTFTDTSTNAPTSWSWDFAHDGATSTTQNP
jgi:PKD repeat protein